MLSSVAVAFGCAEGARGAAIARTLLLVPRLAGPAFVSAEIGFRRSTGRIVARLHFALAGYTTAVRDRISFWIAREGGAIRPLASMPPEDAARIDAELSSCDPCERWISEEGWNASVRRILSAAGIEAPRSDPDRPVLCLYVGGPGWDGVAYESDARVLVVPSPLAPPVGDDFLLELDAPGSRPFAYRGMTRVVASRTRGAAVPGMPAGFALAIQRDAEAAHAMLSSRCASPGLALGVRVAPRYRVAGPVNVEKAERTGLETVEYASAEALKRDWVSNLSHGGAFISTASEYAVGARLDLRLRLPNGEDLTVGATVVRAMRGGVGVQFDLDERADAGISAAMTAIPGRPRRVLVVDDDALARRMLMDALEERGIECVTAADGAAGLHALAEDLMSIDAIVTDVNMPGLTGDKLIEVVRTAGGERDLPIVAVGATVSDGVRARLLAAGANAVLSKDDGPERAVDAVEDSIEARATVRR